MPLILPETMEATWLENGIATPANLQDLNFEISVCSQKLNQTSIHRNQKWAHEKAEYPELAFSELPISQL